MSLSHLNEMSICKMSVDKTFHSGTSISEKSVHKIPLIKGLLLEFPLVKCLRFMSDRQKTISICVCMAKVKVEISHKVATSESMPRNTIYFGNGSDQVTEWKVIKIMSADNLGIG